MASIRRAFAALTVVGASAVTPIDKVINLIENMKSETEADGRSEAAAYGKFACFCKKTTGTKAGSIKKENDNIDSLSADIGDKTQSKADDSTELAKRKADELKLKAELAESESILEKDTSEYQVEEADYSKAISSMKSAIKAMKDSGAGASLLSVQEGLSQTLALADAMNIMPAPKRKAIASFLQGKATVDPDDPDYKYHSNDIADLLGKMLGEFKANKKTLDEEFAKAKKAAEEYQASKRTAISGNADAMESLSKSIAKLEKEIATHRIDLLNSQSTLKDDEDYLKDLTGRCEARADDFDQRSSMRNDEITALTTALKVLKDKVSPADAVNERAMLIQKPKEEVPVVAVVAAKSSQKPISLLQDVLMKHHAKSLRGGSSLEDKKKHAIAMLNAEGQRLNSLVLTSLVAQSAADPFKKVKGLIQKLIERLLTESKNEASKKGFCDTELGKARKDRDFRRTESKDISADLASLEAKEDALTEEIKSLTKALKNENIALKEETEDRASEKAANLQTLQTAKDGHEAVSEALLVLRSFYKQAAKASFLQASPVAEDAANPGSSEFTGSYSGNQSGSQAVLALLETIQSDFDRTLRTTEAAEKEAHREFVKFNQAARSSIASKETKTELDQQDLKSTKTKIKSKFDDLRATVELLDNAFKELEELQPTCVDTGMSYSERVKKREEEMAALKKALCMLDDDDKPVEAECQ